MSAPRCAVCHDSGSKNQTGDYLDCPACDMPHTRKALNDFVKSLGPTHPEDVALAIHQRALAIGLADAVEGVLTEMQPGGALHMPQEPVTHLKYWAAQRWSGCGDHEIEHGEGLEVCEPGEIGADGLPAFPVFMHAIPGALAMAPKQEATAESLPEMTDDLIFEWAEGYVFTLKGMPHKMTFSRPRFVEAVRTIIAHLPTPVAAPASANSSPELPCAECRTDMHIDGKGQAAYSADQMRAYGQACHALGRGAAVREYVENGTFKQPAAAAGPDAALIELIQKHWSGAYFHGVTKAEAREINEVLALSGAKGN